MTEPDVKAGTKVYCENDHCVCEVVKDLYLGQHTSTWGDHFGHWRDRKRKPLVGGPTPYCGFCGGAIEWPGWGGRKLQGKPADA
jgi:hypothetical protein